MRLRFGWLFGLLGVWACAGVTDPRANADDAGVLAEWEGGSVSAAELQGALEGELRELEVRYQLRRYELLQRALDGRVEAALIEQARVDGGYSSVEALIHAEVQEKVGEPDEGKLQAAYQSLVAQMPDAQFEVVRPHLAGQLRAEAEVERRLAWIAELKERANLKVMLDYPALPPVQVTVREHDPQHGQPGSRVRVVMFGEFQCHHCRRALPVLLRIAKEPDVEVVFKDFPTAGHDVARAAAVAARCAGAQGRYWEMASALMEQQDQLGTETIAGLADRLGLDDVAWAACTRDGIWQERIDADIADGHAAGVEVTPTFFVNGHMLTGALAWSQLAGLVEQERRRGR